MTIIKTAKRIIVFALIFSAYCRYKAMRRLFAV